jgi:hypothetical protein
MFNMFAISDMYETGDGGRTTIATRDENGYVSAIKGILLRPSVRAAVFFCSGAHAAWGCHAA